MLAQSALALLLLVLSAFVAASPAPLDRVTSDLVFMETLQEIESWDVGTEEQEEGRESGDKTDIEEGRELGACESAQDCPLSLGMAEVACVERRCVAVACSPHFRLYHSAHLSSTATGTSVPTGNAECRPFVHPRLKIPTQIERDIEMEGRAVDEWLEKEVRRRMRMERRERRRRVAEVARIDDGDEL